MLEIPMLSEVNKDSHTFISFLLHFVPPPPPPFINFSKSLKPPCLFLPPVYYEPESSTLASSQSTLGLVWSGRSAAQLPLR